MLFSERCSGCHTLTPAGTQGTANRALRQQGPNLDQRAESFDDVLFAIRNGGFSGAIMPQNIVTGREATSVAEFVSKYAGSEAGETSASRAPASGLPVGERARPGAPLMLDLRSIREDPEPARAALARRGAAEALDELLRLDERRRELLPEVEERRARQNRASDRDRRGEALRARTPSP